MKAFDKALAVFLCAICFANISQGQDSPKNDDSPGFQDSNVYMVVDQKPELPGGRQAMFHFIRDTINFPEQADAQGIEGTVIVKFIITKNEVPVNPRIKTGLTKACNREALKAIRHIPPWEPGKRKGKKVHTQLFLPNRFKAGW